MFTRHTTACDVGSRQPAVHLANSLWETTALATLTSAVKPAVSNRFRSLERLIGNTPLLAIEFEFRGRRQERRRL